MRQLYPRRGLATATSGLALGIVIPYTSSVSMSSGRRPPGGDQSKQWKSLARALSTRITPSGAPGHLRLPALNGRILKSGRWLISTRPPPPSAGRCLSGRNSSTSVQMRGFRPSASVLMKILVCAGMS